MGGCLDGWMDDEWIKTRYIYYPNIAVNDAFSLIENNSSLEGKAYIPPERKTTGVGYFCLG